MEKQNEAGKEDFQKEIEPAAWMHTLDNTDGIEGNEPLITVTFCEDSPFGVPGKDYSACYQVSSEPLYTRPIVDAPSDVSTETNDKLRGLMRRLGMATEESLETFGFTLEGNILRTISAVNRLLDRIADPSNDVEKDAARYRWLKENCVTEGDAGDKGIEFQCDFEHYNDIDAAIDCAMK